MKKTGFWKGFGSGMVLTALVAGLCVTATAASRRSIEVEDGIRISLNGTAFTPRDAAGREVSVFLYNGTTYAPVRAIGEAMGLHVSFDSAARTVRLVSGGQESGGLPAGDSITAEQAKEIALADAGVRAADAVLIRAQMDWDDGRAEYDVEFYSGNTEYDYEIDAVTGAIRSADRDVEGFYIPSGSGELISRERAQEIALAQVPGAKVTKCALDRDDGRQVYEVELRSGRTEYDFEIDARTGGILSRDVDYD